MSRRSCIALTPHFDLNSTCSDCAHARSRGKVACTGHDRVALWNWHSMKTLGCPVVEYYDRKHFICLVCEEAEPTRPSLYKKAFGWRGDAFKSHCTSVVHSRHVRSFCMRHGTARAFGASDHNGFVSMCTSRQDLSSSPPSLHLGLEPPGMSPTPSCTPYPSGSVPHVPQTPEVTGWDKMERVLERWGVSRPTTSGSPCPGSISQSTACLLPAAKSLPISTVIRTDVNRPN
jgi:hypothetical protein